MTAGHFYFLKSEYLQQFPNSMSNREHNRPYFCAFTENDSIFWVIPISSKVKKFENIYAAKVKRYGKCDTIDFCSVLGRKKAVLIQNMCPITKEYVLNKYLDTHQNPVQICDKVRKRIIHKAKKVLALQRNGIDLLFGDVLQIEKKLMP
jgi:hypothetical protein